MVMSISKYKIKKEQCKYVNYQVRNGLFPFCNQGTGGMGSQSMETTSGIQGNYLNHIAHNSLQMGINQAMELDAVFGGAAGCGKVPGFAV